MNPLRWSGSVTFSKAINDLRQVCQHGERPVFVKVPSGVTTERQRFETTTEAVNYLISLHPVKVAAKEVAARAQDDAEAQLEQAEAAAQEAAATWGQVSELQARVAAAKESAAKASSWKRRSRAQLLEAEKALEGAKAAAEEAWEKRARAEEEALEAQRRAAQEQEMADR
eukprot:CAMPEP_0113825484 /NCGR_PEP_ID=MMETSP0328-20130328/3771_1 /TAXON_ID=39455 /ORGANISM="Alexandrium minutum" /LENGTH=169 /DNA_ID=CAMNT_0000793435 /DNA_START=1 /DNA_END=507 /DNA_ORIENTATION=+ /assembly_acc=CAM_ASM_000350